MISLVRTGLWIEKNVEIPLKKKNQFTAINVCNQCSHRDSVIMDNHNMEREEVYEVDFTYLMAP